MYPVRLDPDEGVIMDRIAQPQPLVVMTGMPECFFQLTFNSMSTFGERP